MSRICDDLDINHGTLILDGFLDHQDEMELWESTGDFRTFIDRDQAQSVVAHLTKVFGL